MSDQFDDAMLHLREAGEYLNKLEFDKAISSATKAITLFPDLAPAYIIRGNAHYGKEDYVKSIEDQTSAIKFTEKKEKEFEKLLASNGKINEALDELRKSKAAIYFHRGNAYDDSGDFENAEKDFSESIKLNPEFVANVYNSRGILYNKNGDYISAIEDFTKAIQNDYALLHFAYNNRADALHHLERYKDALSDCQKAIEIAPTYAHAYNTYGLVYASMGDIDNAQLYYKKAIAIDPNYSEPKHNLQNLGKKPTKYDSSTSVSIAPDDDIWS
jgi:tetratricopeptide (TPR) repeat protein